jgi:hypothetical protein
MYEIAPCGDDGGSSVDTIYETKDSPGASVRRAKDQGSGRVGPILCVHAGVIENSAGEEYRI